MHRTLPCPLICNRHRQTGRCLPEPPPPLPLRPASSATAEPDAHGAPQPDVSATKGLQAACSGGRKRTVGFSHCRWRACRRRQRRWVPPPSNPPPSERGGSSRCVPRSQRGHASPGRPLTPLRSRWVGPKLGRRAGGRRTPAGGWGGRRPGAPRPVAWPPPRCHRPGSPLETTVLGAQAPWGLPSGGFWERKGRGTARSRPCRLAPPAAHRHPIDVVRGILRVIAAPAGPHRPNPKSRPPPEAQTGRRGPCPKPQLL